MKLRVWYIIIGTEPFFKEVSSPEEAKLVIDSIAAFLNAKVNEGVFPDHCSTAGLEEWDEERQDWVEWYDEDGLSLDEHFEQENNE